MGGRARLVLALLLLLAAALSVRLLPSGPEPAPQPVPPAVPPAVVGPEKREEPPADARLAIRFVDAVGSGVPDVQAVLLPEEIRLPASGAHGAAALGGLAAGVRRLRVVSPHRLEYRIPDLTRRTLSAPPPPGFGKEAGPGELRSGLTTSLTLKVERSGAVSGTVAGDPARSGRAVVHLFRGEDFGEPEPGVNRNRWQWHAENVVEADGTGAYRFEDAWPGRKRVEASWRTDGAFDFGETHGDVLPGRETSMPTIRAIEGATLKAVVKLRARDRLPAEWRDRPLAARLEVCFREGTVNTSIAVRLDEPLVLRGIRARIVLLRAEAVDRVPGVLWLGSGLESFDAPFEETAELEVEPRALHPVKLTVEFPPGAVSSPLRLLVQPHPEAEDAADEQGREVERAEPFVLDPGARELALPRGRYLVQAGPADEDADWYGEAAVDAGPGSAVVRLILGRGATIRGVARLEGSDEPETSRIRVMGLGDYFTGPCFLERSPDEQGRFVLRGLPPDREIRISRLDEPIRTGPSGSERTIDLRLSR
jgi:hypothetical protein